MILIFMAMLLPPTSQPQTATLYDQAFANARATWVASGSGVGGHYLGGSMSVASGFQQITKPIDFSNIIGAKLVGDANACVFRNDNGRTFDASGARNLTLRDIELRGESFFGRRPDGASAGVHRVDNVTFGTLIIEGAETILFTGCKIDHLIIRNGAPKPSGFTMQQITFLGCDFANGSGPAIEITVSPNAVVTDITFDGGGMGLWGGGEAAVILNTGDTPDRQMKMIHFANMRCETDRRVFVQQHGKNGVIGLTIRDCTPVQRESVVRADSPLYQCDFRNVDCFPSDATYRGPAIDGVMSGGECKLLNARGYASEVRP